jgi:hypothetical protein
MRTVALCALFGLVGCVKPNDPEAPPPVEDVPLRAVVAPEPFPQVPQDEADLKCLERFREHGTALQRDLANGRFTGGKLEDLLAAHPPDLLLHHPPYTTAVYANGCPQNRRDSNYVIARNGKLVRAVGPGCFYFTFFNGLTDAEREEWAEGFEAVFRAHCGLPPLPAPDDGTIPLPREVTKPTP